MVPRVFRAIAAGLMLVATVTTSAASGPSAVEAAARVREDARLLAALRADPALRPCKCLLAAAWLDETYLRITVDPKRWRLLSAAERTSFGEHALHDVRAVYLAEWGTQYFYDQVFIVDPGGRQLFAYAP
jgi:hypothetical protein